MIFRFDGVDEVIVKITIDLIYAMAMYVCMYVCIIESLVFNVYILIVPIFGTAMTVIHGDLKGHRRADNCDMSNSVRRVALSDDYCTAKSPFCMELLTWGVPWDPLRPTVCALLKQIDHALFSLRKWRPCLICLPLSTYSYKLQPN